MRAAAALWMTPDVPNGGRGLALDAIKARGATEKGKRQVGLENQARLWGSPKSSPSGPDFARAGREGSGGDDLATQARLWNTPRACAEKAGRPRAQDRDGLQEKTIRFSRPRPETETPGSASSPSGPTSPRPSLNPAFVEWLMGWPPGWTACACSETAWSRWSLRMRGALSALPCGSALVKGLVPERE